MSDEWRSLLNVIDAIIIIMMMIKKLEEVILETKQLCVRNLEYTIDNINKIYNLLLINHIKENFYVYNTYYYLGAPKINQF